MPKRSTSIPVNLMANEFGAGIAIDRITVSNLEGMDMESARQPHREDGHSFFLLETGDVSLEVDFQHYTIGPFTIVYMHPSQVHRILQFNNVTVTSWSVTEEQLDPEYLRLLQTITPAKPLALPTETFSVLAGAAAQCIRFFERKKDRLYHSILRDSCNALIALVIAAFLEDGEATAVRSRAGDVTKAFKELLECYYTSERRPAAYARRLHLSPTYLNECVRSATGYPVSHHIQQRVLLEAKRLLSHSDKTVKEIAAELGFDDYPYFSRFFNRFAGMTAIAFRGRNPG